MHWTRLLAWQQLIDRKSDAGCVDQSPDAERIAGRGDWGEVSVGNHPGVGAPYEQPVSERSRSRLKHCGYGDGDDACAVTGASHDPHSACRTPPSAVDMTRQQREIGCTCPPASGFGLMPVRIWQRLRADLVQPINLIRRQRQVRRSEVVRQLLLSPRPNDY